MGSDLVWARWQSEFGKGEGGLCITLELSKNKDDAAVVFNNEMHLELIEVVNGVCRFELIAVTTIETAVLCPGLLSKTNPRQFYLDLNRERPDAIANIWFNNDEIKFELTACGGGKARLSINAPKHIKILRKKLWLASRLKESRLTPKQLD